MTFWEPVRLSVHRDTYLCGQRIMCGVSVYISTPRLVFWCHQLITDGSFSSRISVRSLIRIILLHADLDNQQPLTTNKSKHQQQENTKRRNAINSLILYPKLSIKILFMVHFMVTVILICFTFELNSLFKIQWLITCLGLNFRAKHLIFILTVFFVFVFLKCLSQ